MFNMLLAVVATTTTTTRCQNIGKVGMECQFTVKLDLSWPKDAIDQGQSDCIVLALDRETERKKPTARWIAIRVPLSGTPR
jgi:hypothetical protein